MVGTFVRVVVLLIVRFRNEVATDPVMVPAPAKITCSPELPPLNAPLLVNEAEAVMVSVELLPMPKEVDAPILILLQTALTVPLTPITGILPGP